MNNEQPKKKVKTLAGILHFLTLFKREGLYGISFILILLYGVMLSIGNFKEFLPVKGFKFFNGGWANQYQSQYEIKLPLRESATQAWGLVRYTFFHEGWPGVLIGKAGWLFTEEEFVFYKQAAKQMDIKRNFIRTVRDKLNTRNIALVVALIPDKARIYPEKLGRYTYPAYAEERYYTFRNMLLEAGVTTPDLTKVFVKAKSLEQVWLRTDTHWTPAGAQRAAETLAAVARPVLDARHVPFYPYQLKTTPAQMYKGDLLQYVPLGSLGERVGLVPDAITTFVATALNTPVVTDSKDLFSDVHIPVTIVGTSFSAGEVWAFDDALKFFLKADVLNLAEQGQGPFTPMQKYLASDTLDTSPPELVIWEIPERYLPVDYPGL